MWESPGLYYTAIRQDTPIKQKKVLNTVKYKVLINRGARTSCHSRSFIQTTSQARGSFPIPSDFRLESGVNGVRKSPFQLEQQVTPGGLFLRCELEF